MHPIRVCGCVCVCVPAVTLLALQFRSGSGGGPHLRILHLYSVGFATFALKSEALRYGHSMDASSAKCPPLFSKKNSALAHVSIH